MNMNIDETIKLFLERLDEKLALAEIGIQNLHEEFQDIHNELKELGDEYETIHKEIEDCKKVIEVKNC